MTEIHMADMTTIKEKIRETIYPNGTGAITAEKHQALLIDLVNDINKQKADAEALTELEEKVDSLPVGGDVKANGVYPDLIAGDLVGRGESVPAEFTFRASGGKSIKDGRAYIKRIKGNSVVWNQKLRNSRIENADYWYSLRSNAEFNGQGVHIVATAEFSNLCQNARLILGHKYLLYASAKGNNGYRLNLNLCGQDTRGEYLSDNYAPHYYFIQFNECQSDMVQLYVIANDADWYVKDCRLIDLTQEFQAGNEPTTIEEFNARKPIVADEYAYNEGEVIHCNTESIKSIGDNAWDEQWEVGTITTADGSPHESEVMLRSKNYIKVLPSQKYHYLYSGAIKEYALIYFYDDTFRYISYYSNWEINRDFDFTTPSNCCYIKFVEQATATYKNNIMIRLDHSGWKSNTGVGYEPYWQDILPLPIIRKYFPDGMMKAGSAHDEIRYNKATKKWEYSKGKIKSVDLGTLSIMSWTATANGVEYQYFYTNDLIGIGVPPNYGEVGNAIVAPYTIVSALGLANRELPNKSVMAYNAPGLQVYFRDDAYADAESFKAAMAGVILYYESNDWEWVELDAEDQNFRDYYNVADFGTEQMLAELPSAPFSADIIYQFNAVDMIREHELEITQLQTMIATMQAQLASLTKN